MLSDKLGVVWELIAPYLEYGFLKSSMCLVLEKLICEYLLFLFIICLHHHHHKLVLLQHQMTPFRKFTYKYRCYCLHAYILIVHLP